MRSGFAWAATIGILMLAGCAEKENLSVSNLPPDTHLAIGDSIRNPTVYIQTVRWWGEDIDGEVAGYEYRWQSDPAEPCSSLNQTWVFTEETSKQFNLPVTEGVRSHTIEVRAIDDQEAADPDPAAATFPVFNSPPTVNILDGAELPDTTLPAILIKWQGEDPEGDETIQSYRVWLDGQEDEAIVVGGDATEVSFGHADFKGTYGERTLHLIAIDSGCAMSDTASYTWHVKAPEGDILLVDDLSKADYSFPEKSDAFFREALAACVDGFTVLDLGEYGGVTYAHNLNEVLGLFALVVWYNDVLAPGTTSLAFAEEAITSYVRDGGRILIVSMGAFGDGGALGDSLTLEAFGIDSLYMRDDNTNFDCKRWEIKANADLGLDSLKVTGIYIGVECMRPSLGVTKVYHIPPGTAGAMQTEDYYLGILNPWEAGKAAIITFPMSRGDYYGNAQFEFCKIIDLMLD
jgi:hypothetical protein